jgi:tRNA (guanine-N7-)-methyltransferase
MSITPEKTLAPDLELLPGRIDGPLRFHEIFGRTAPVEIEVGIGSGRFILNEAASRPAVDFLGLEWSLKHLRVAKERAEKRGLTNIRFHRADARHVLSDLVPDASVARLHVYCPDPWPKKRHRKRRFFTPAMAVHIGRILAPGGYLDLSTDVLEYFEEIRETLAAREDLAPASDPLFPLEPAEGKTNYEVKYLAAGRPIYRATYRNVSRSRG